MKLYGCNTCGFICNKIFKNCPNCGVDLEQLLINKERIVPNNKIEFITCDSKDWEVLKVNGELFIKGHRIECDYWMKLLEKMAYTEVEYKNISDEDMEDGNY